MKRTLGLVGRGGPVGRTPGWSRRSGQVRGMGRLLHCRVFCSVGG